MTEKSIFGETGAACLSTRKTFRKKRRFVEMHVQLARAGTHVLIVYLECIF